MDYVDPDVHCSKKVDKLTHSLTASPGSDELNMTLGICLVLTPCWSGAQHWHNDHNALTSPIILREWWPSGNPIQLTDLLICPDGCALLLNKYSSIQPLTRWGWDKMATIFQTFSNAFSWMKMYKFWLKFCWSFFPKGSIDNIPALVQIMAWGLVGAKPWSEPMMESLLMHICVTRPQWLDC